MHNIDYEINLLRIERLNERMNAREAVYEFSDFPRQGEERYEALQHWALSECEVPPELLAHDNFAVPIKKVWVNEPSSGTGDDSYPISSYILDPGKSDLRYRRDNFIDRRRRERADRRPYFTAFEDYESPLLDGDLLRMRKELLGRINSDLDCGNFCKHDECYEITLGKRRPLTVSHSDICLGLFLEDRIRILNELYWSAANVKPELYRSVVAPHYRDREIGSELPFQWAKDRLAIVNGFAQTLMGRDYSLLAAEYSYREVAHWACNLRPATNEQNFKFPVSAKSEELLSCLEAGLSPEAAYLVLRLEERLTPANLRTAEFQSFLAQLPEFLNRGLNVERIVELVNDLSENSGFKSEYMSYATALVAKVYSTDTPPWWFHENQSLIPSSKPKDWGSATCLDLHLKLASLSGPLYQYTKDIWENGGKQLSKFYNVDQQAALLLNKIICEKYGVGHEQRALNVLAFAKKCIGETAPEERPNTMQSLGEMFIRHRPASEIIGALEGSDANFAKPGIYALYRNLTGKTEDKVEGLLSLNFSPQRLSETIQACSKPLEERARIAPSNRLNYEPATRFITDVSKANVLCLPVPKEFRLSGPTNSPLRTWLQYDEQLHKEVAPREQAAVSELYLTYFAHKMPHPFAPPVGFLSFLNTFRHLRDPHWQPSFLFHPDEREGVEVNQAKQYIDRMSILGSWIDTAVLGIQTYEEVLDTFRWIILERDNPELSRDVLSFEKMQLQCETAWEALDSYNRDYLFSKQNGHAYSERELSSLLHKGGDRELELIAQISKKREQLESVQALVQGYKQELEALRERRESLEDGLGADSDRKLEVMIAAIKKEETQLVENSACLDVSRLEKRLADLEHRLKHVQNKMRTLREYLSDVPAIHEKFISDELDPALRDERDFFDQNTYRDREHYSRSYRDNLFYLETAAYDTPDLGFEDPYVDPEAALEEERLREEERNADPMDLYFERMGIDDKVRAKQNERFQQLTYSLEYLSCLTALATGNAFGQIDFRSAVSILSTSIKDGSLIFHESPRQVLGDFKRAAETLKEMMDHGVANIDKIAHDFQVFSTPQNLLDIIKDINALIEPYRKAKDIIEYHLKSGSTFNSQYDYVEHIDETLLTSLEGVFDNRSPYFVSDAAKIMLNDFFWLVRYKLLLPHVRAFDTAEFPGGDEYYSNDTEIDPTLRSGMRICGTVFLFAEASKVFREQGNDPFLKVASADNILRIPHDAIFPRLLLPSSSQEQRTSESEIVLPAPYQNVPLIKKIDSDEKIIPFHVSQGLHQKMRNFREQVIECRMQDFGLLANGGKVHVIHEIDAYRLEFLKAHFGFTGTQFMVDNAKHLVTLPPTASSAEISLISNFLNTEGIIDWEFPEIQMCIAGRVSIENCAILGSGVMWLSNVNVPYNESSFKTNRDDETGFRIMIYDAGGARNMFPFDIMRDRGRTDMLGRRTLSDFKIYQRLGSVLSYSEELLDGSNQTIKLKHLDAFHCIARQFQSDYRTVLDRNGLGSILEELWLNPTYAFDGKHERDLSDSQRRYLKDHSGGDRHFKRAILPVMEAWLASEELSEKAGESAGIRAAVEAIYGRLENDVRNLQQDMLEDPYYESHRKALFNLNP